MCVLVPASPMKLMFFFVFFCSKLSACVDALQSILFPFVWQHTFIPVLPSNMLDICQAPTPYIIGVLKGKHPILPPVSIDHVSFNIFTFELCDQGLKLH